ncbi:MAG: hypothetical protein WBG27_07255, partial [Candidatus Aquilonibacter sp.]
MLFAHGLLAAALLAVAPSFFAGPAHVGDRVTYEISTAMGAAPATPNVSTLMISWTTGTRLFARLSTGLPGSAVALTRNGDGTLSVASPNPSDPAIASIQTLLGQLNFPGLLAARLDGSDHAQTTLTVAPPAPTASASPAPVIVPLDLSLVSSSAGTTLIAQGNTNQNASSRSGRSGSGGGRRGGSMGGSMGGWHSSGSVRSQNGSTGKGPSIDIAAEAIFDQSGSLEHATYRETITTPSSNGSQSVEHTITIDRVT